MRRREERPEDGRVRLAVVENRSKEKFQAFIKGQFKEESTVHTDGWRAYVGIENSGYAHIRNVMDGGWRRRTWCCQPSTACSRS